MNVARSGFLLAALLFTTAPVRAEDAPLQVQLSLPGPESEFGIERPPALVVSVRNKGTEPVTLAGPLRTENAEIHHLWTLGLGAELRLQGLGQERNWRPTVADCGAGEPRTLAPGDSRTTRIYLQRFLTFARGKHSVSLTVRDALGRSATSEPVTFFLRDPPRRGKLEVELLSHETVVSDDSWRDGCQRFVVRLTNLGRRRLAVLPPHDRSWETGYGVTVPHYWFEIRDAAGRLVPALYRRALGDPDLKKDQSYVLLQGGASHQLEAVLPTYLYGGRYTARLHYVVSERPKGPNLSKHAKRLFCGRARSNTLTVFRPGPQLHRWASEEAPGALARKLARVCADPRSSRRTSWGALRLLQRTVWASALEPADATVARDTLIDLATRSRSYFVSKALLALGDESCAPAFEHMVLSLPGEEDPSYGGKRHLFFAVKGWAQAAGQRSVAARLLAELGREGTELDRVLRALAALTDQGELNYFSNGCFTRWPRTPADYETVRSRWRAWWERAQPN